MSKAGRKRKLGERFPNGKLKPAQRVSTAIYWQREREELRRNAKHPEFGTPLGILFRGEKITATQFGAGVRFAADRKDADTALSLPARNCQAQDIVSVKGGNGAEDDHRAEIRKAKDIRAYDNAEDAVGRATRELAALQSVVVYERSPEGQEQFIALLEGLDRLAKHYGVAK